jgi:hypothetical protein
VKETRSRARGVFDIALVFGRMHLLNDAIRVGVRHRIADDPRRETCTPNAFDCRVQPCRPFGMIETGVVPVEDRARVDVQHDLKSLTNRLSGDCERMPLP